MNIGLLKMVLKSASIEDKIKIVELILDSLKKEKIKEILNKYDK